MIPKVRATAVGVLIATSTVSALTTTSARADTGVSNNQTYTVTMMPIDGSTPDAKGQWPLLAS